MPLTSASSRQAVPVLTATAPRCTSPPLELVAKQPQVPMLVLGGGVTMVGVLRILGRAHLPLYSICDRNDLATRSRWYREPPLHGAGDLSPDDLPAFLRLLPFNRAVLLPCTDDWVKAVVSLPEHLASQFPCSVPEASVACAIMDKWRFAKLLDATATPHPRTILLRSREELESAAANITEQTILKPLSSTEFARKHGVKGYVVSRAEEAISLGAKIDFPIMWQEYIPGPPTANYFVDGFADRKNRVCTQFARRRLRMYPLDLGNSSLMVSIPLHEVGPALDSLNALLARIHYRGIFSAEFKYDQRDGIFKILEINTRPWWYIEFAAHCGIDVCRFSYLDALNLPLKPLYQYLVGRQCVFLVQDFRAYRTLRSSSGLGFSSWVRSWMTAEDTLFVLDDLRPGLTLLMDVLKSRLHLSPSH